MRRLWSRLGCSWLPLGSGPRCPNLGQPPRTTHPGPEGETLSSVSVYTQSCFTYKRNVIVSIVLMCKFARNSYCGNGKKTAPWSTWLLIYHHTLVSICILGCSIENHSTTDTRPDCIMCCGTLGWASHFLRKSVFSYKLCSFHFFPYVTFGGCIDFLNQQPT